MKINIAINNKRLYQIIIFIFLNIIFTSCAKTVKNGVYFSEYHLNQLQEGKNLSKQNVRKILGQPNYISDANNIWYYVGITKSSKPLFGDKVIGQNILQLNFNNKNILSDFVTIENNNRSINIDKDRTILDYNKQTKLQKFIYNIGRFSKNKPKLIRANKKPEMP